VAVGRRGGEAALGAAGRGWRRQAARPAAAGGCAGEKRWRRQVGARWQVAAAEGGGWNGRDEVEEDDRKRMRACGGAWWAGPPGVRHLARTTQGGA
jgi:hypothetical protein